MNKGVVVLELFLVLRPFLLCGQLDTALDAKANQQKAQFFLAQTIAALGGSAWLNVQSMRVESQEADFFQDALTGEVHDVIKTYLWPDKTRVEQNKHRVVQIYAGASGWEITYKGKRTLPPDKVEAYQRALEYSLETVLRVWYHDPATMLIDEGQMQIDRQVAEQIEIINSKKELVTLVIDAGNYLPLRLSYTWRDPRFHDESTSRLEFTRYQNVQGIETPFAVTHWENGEIVHETYVKRIEFNVKLSADTFDPDAVARRLK